MDYSTITITFGDQAENHAGMQKIGELADKGFTINELENAKIKFEEKGAKCEFIKLNEYLPDKYKKNKDIEQAAILVIRNGVNIILGDNKSKKSKSDLMFAEQYKLNPDTKYFDTRRQKVLNKRARYNLCFSDQGQVADLKNKKGTIIAYKDVPLTSKIRDEFKNYIGYKAENLAAEGNYYYDIKKCGIGFHGDSERKKVIALRLGATIPLHYHWYTKSNPIGKRVELDINHGDIYIMSEKATGFDWKKRSKITLRHAAGSEKFLRIVKK